MSSPNNARRLNESIEQIRAGLLNTRGERPAATLSPLPKQGLTVDELIEFLSTISRLGDDAESFAEDVKTARSNDSLPGSSWN